MNGNSSPDRSRTVRVRRTPLRACTGRSPSPYVVRGRTWQALRHAGAVAYATGMWGEPSTGGYVRRPGAPLCNQYTIMMP